MDIVTDLLKTVAGGIIAAIITLAITGRRLNKDLERAARTLAIQLTDIFERYALECVDVHNQHANNQRANPYDFSGLATLPAVQELPSDDTGWRALDTALAIDARTFATRRRESANMVASTAEHGNAFDIEAETEDQAIVLGDVAWRIADRFRKRYELGPTHVTWDIVDHFARGLSRISRQAAENVARAAEMRAASNAAVLEQDIP